VRSRTRLFFVGAVLAALMIPVADENVVFVPWIVSITYVVMFILSALEDWDRRRRFGRR
jgi:hypothetical protein